MKKLVMRMKTTMRANIEILNKKTLTKRLNTINKLMTTDMSNIVWRKKEKMTMEMINSQMKKKRLMRLDPRRTMKLWISLMMRVMDLMTRGRGN
jgi:hypothetical protein